MIYGLSQGRDFGSEEDLVLMEEPEAYADEDELVESRSRMSLNEEDKEEWSKPSRGQLALIYSLYLAEA